jgi:hypothetical protein
MMNADLRDTVVIQAAGNADSLDRPPIDPTMIAKHETRLIDATRPVQATQPEYRRTNTERHRKQCKHSDSIWGGQRYSHRFRSTTLPFHD